MLVHCWKLFFFLFSSTWQKKKKLFPVGQNKNIPAAPPNKKCAHTRRETGVLRIAGDPSADGDITMRLEASNETVVSIDTHSKNLTLIKALDKEVINPYIF